jgi:endonuclease/exonuclease/phosphatase (EEP) superfamily protein YafD
MCLVPALLALVCRVIAELAAPDAVWGHVVHSVGLMAPRWLMAVTPLVCLRVAWLTRQWRIPMGLGLVALPLAGVPNWMAPGEGTRILAGNVNAYTGSPAGLAAAIASTGVDVVIEVESRSTEIPGYTRVADNFSDKMPRPSYRSAVFCKDGVHCEAAISEQFGSPSSKMPVALVRLHDGVCLLGMHGPPPVPLDASGLLPHMRRIASHLQAGRISKPWGPCQVGDPVVMLGDFNAVPGSWATRELADTGLEDRLWHWGLFAVSWPFGGDVAVLPALQLDQLWAGPVEVSGIELLRLPGADHRAILATVASRDRR